MVWILYHLFILTKLGSQNAPAIKGRTNKDFLYSASYMISIFDSIYDVNIESTFLKLNFESSFSKRWKVGKTKIIAIKGQLFVMFYFASRLFRLSFGKAERRALARFSFLVCIYDAILYHLFILLTTNKDGMSKIARHKRPSQ